MNIRKATSDDALAIFKIRDLAIQEGCRGFYSPEEIDKWTGGEISDELVSDVADNFYVTEINGVIIGSGRIDLNDGTVDAIFVDPGYMKTGAGKAMMAYLEKLAVNNHLTQLHLESTLNAAPFYRVCGFTGENVIVYHSPRGMDLPCISMSKIINNQTS